MVCSICGNPAIGAGKEYGLYVTCLHNDCIYAAISKVREYIALNYDFSKPGKFEGEQAWVAYYWELVMEGMGEMVFGNGEEPVLLYTYFTISTEDREIFPDIPEGEFVLITESEQGFVHGEVVDCLPSASRGGN